MGVKKFWFSGFLCIGINYRKVLRYEIIVLVFYLNVSCVNVSGNFFMMKGSENMYCWCWSVKIREYFVKEMMFDEVVFIKKFLILDIIDWLLVFLIEDCFLW